MKIRANGIEIEVEDSAIKDASFAAKPAVDFKERLYNASADAIVALIKEAGRGSATLMVVGHNPGMHDLALALAGPLDTANAAMRALCEGYPTGALAEFTVPGPWGSLSEGGARLVRFVAPRDLPEQG